MSDAMTAGHAGLDEVRLADWISVQVPDSSPPLTFQRAGHGYSNLTYRVTDATGYRFVLRRPPVGPILPSAHDMAREHRILTGLAPTPIPAPRPLALCEDPNVTGAPFYLMEHCEGYVIAERAHAGVLVPRARRAASRSLTRVLAALHAVDVDAIGLGDLGRREDYAARQVRRWRLQWEGSKTRELPAIDRVAEALESAAPMQRELALVHGDYRLDNAIVDVTGEVRAVIDWELCTLGDPLADPGLLLVYWSEAQDGPPPLGDPATVLPGFMTRKDVVDAYSEASGRDLELLGYYCTLAYWKLAIIVQGVYRRALDNPANSQPAARDLEPSVLALAASAEASADAAGLI